MVRALAERLRKDGLRVWLDEFVLRPGDNIPAKIEEGLERSRVLVLCLSAAAFGSDWARLESYTFRFRDPLNQERRFIPLRLDETPIKGTLAQFVFIDWRAEARDLEYAKLIEACRPATRRLDVEAGEAREWDVERGIQLHTGRTTTFAFSPDGKRVLTGEYGPVGLWDAETGRHRRMLEGHTAGVWSVEWRTDQRRALSGSHDRTVRVWDTDTGKCLRVLEGHTDDVDSGAASRI